jgi:hypothetical protein
MRFSHGVITACASAAIVAGGLQLPQALAQSSSGAFSILQQRWGNREGFKNLFYWVSETKPNRRSNYFLILKKADRDKAIMKLDVMVPSYFDSELKTKNIRLSYCKGGEGFMNRTICEETIPAAISLVNDGKTIQIVPETPIPPDRTIGVVFRVANPSNGGMYQFNALAQAPGKVDIAGYLGSWVIEIQPGGAR